MPKHTPLKSCPASRRAPVPWGGASSFSQEPTVIFLQRLFVLFLTHVPIFTWLSLGLLPCHGVYVCSPTSGMKTCLSPSNCFYPSSPALTLFHSTWRYSQRLWTLQKMGSTSWEEQVITGRSPKVMGWSLSLVFLTASWSTVTRKTSATHSSRHEVCLRSSHSWTVPPRPLHRMT